MTRKLTLASAAAVAVAVALTGTADAQWALSDKGAVAVAARASDSEPETWGTTAETVVTYFAHDFHLGTGVDAPWDGLTGGRLCDPPSPMGCYWLAGVHLPNGAEIRSVEVSACDGDPTGLIAWAFVKGPKVPGPPEFLVPYTGTGVRETPGCSSFVVNLAAPHTVDNNTWSYGMVVAADPGAAIQWNAYRVRYRLQVSPAPAAATFTDVPVGHAQYRFVEALAASGITGGCSGGNFCPEAPLTRGQMAVFLAVALGLHFPN
jgi:hypothetical protein